MKFEYSCGIIPIYLNDKKKFFLLVKWRHSHWGFPKWHVEFWENCIETALREFEEETNIPQWFVDLKEGKKYEDKYWFVLNWEKILKKVTYFLWFLKNWFEDHIRPQQWEIYEIKLVPSSKVIEFIEFDSLKKIVKQVLNDLKKISN